MVADDLAQRRIMPMMAACAPTHLCTKPQPLSHSNTSAKSSSDLRRTSPRNLPKQLNTTLAFRRSEGILSNLTNLTAPLRMKGASAVKRRPSMDLEQVTQRRASHMILSFVHLSPRSYHATYSGCQHVAEPVRIISRIT
jgi:hypothetical protein